MWKGVLGREPTCKEERSSERVAGMRGEGWDEVAEVAEESQDMKVEASECPEGAYFVPW
jgi:hypothetical protein